MRLGASTKLAEELEAEEPTAHKATLRRVQARCREEHGGDERVAEVATTIDQFLGILDKMRAAREEMEAEAASKPPGESGGVAAGD